MAASPSRLSRRLPLGYGAIAIVAAAVLLPTALRPPPDTANSSNQYSPDAPPDKKADAIVRSVQLGSSSVTAGQPPPVIVRQTPPPPVVGPTAPPRGSRSGCFPGSPPLQFESVYSVPCQPIFVGNNGGSTQPGITRDSITLLMAPCNRSYGDDANTTHEIDDSTQSQGTPDETLNDLKKYFNKHAEMYGRQLRFWYAGCSDNNDVQTPISALHPLAGVFGSGTDVAAKNHVYSWDYGGNNYAYHRKLDPYNWAAVASGDDTAGVAAEYVCKSLKGYKPFATGDQTPEHAVQYDKPRVFGAIQSNDPNAESIHQLLNGLKTCGVTPNPEVETYFTSSGDIAGAIAKMRANHVSTIIWNNDLFSLAEYMTAAESVGYRPEWFMTGWGGADIAPSIVRAYPATQVKNMFGLTMNEIARDPRLNECFRAVREVDPGFTPDAQTCGIFWAPVAHMVDAIQIAGPHLTTQTFGESIPRIPHLDPDPKHYWAPSGGYRKDKWSYPDSAAVWWWDSVATGVDGQPGTYVYGECARRYRIGTFPVRQTIAYQARGSATGMTLATCHT